MTNVIMMDNPLFCYLVQHGMIDLAHPIERIVSTMDGAKVVKAYPIIKI